jgi:hypothetical protein
LVSKEVNGENGDDNENGDDDENDDDVNLLV